jgi:hypothetical protein
MIRPDEVEEKERAIPPIIPVVEPGRDETDIGALYRSSTQARSVGQRPTKTVSSSKPAYDAYRQTRGASRRAADNDAPGRRIR